METAHREDRKSVRQQVQSMGDSQTGQ